MNASDRTAIFETLPVHQAVYKQIIPAIVSQMIALIYNLADTYFCWHASMILIKRPPSPLLLLHLLC